MIDWLIAIVLVTMALPACLAWWCGRRKRRERQELWHITGAPVWWGKR